jgi:hypothetical protein
MEDFNLEALTVFKLMNGEVIICEVVSENDHKFWVRCAIRAIELFTDDEEEVRFAQWIPFTDDLIALNKHGILASAPPNEDMKQMYLNKLAEPETPEEEPTSKDEVTMRPQCFHPSIK